MKGTTLITACTAGQCRRITCCTRSPVMYFFVFQWRNQDRWSSRRCLIRIRPRRGVHIFEISRRQTGHFGKVPAQLVRQSIDDPRAPSLGGLRTKMSRPQGGAQRAEYGQEVLKLDHA
jgi:hypothetical protein